MLSTPASRDYVHKRWSPAWCLLLASLLLPGAGAGAQQLAVQAVAAGGTTAARAAATAPAATGSAVAAVPQGANAGAAAAGSAIPRPPALQRDVDFWIRIYSEVTTSEGLLHDEWDLSVVYAKLQFPPNTEPKARREAVDAARERYVAGLKAAAAALSARTPGSALDQASLGEETRRVLQLWGDAVTPTRLLEAAGGVRFQLGQADRFRAGVVRSGAWEAHIAETFANLGLPPELAALPHVESSFIPTAYSKVGASGLWQFMRSTGRRYMRVDDYVDERLDPFRSTEAAAQLLAYNFRVLGSWPLALTAYNHGAAGMRRAKESMGTDDFVTIARGYRSRSFGFASRNFYPSFLAALTIDQNPEKYFGAIERDPELRFREVAMPGYARIAAIERAVEVPRARLRELNPALLGPIWSGSRLVPRGYRLRLPPGEEAFTSEWLAMRIGANELFAAQIQSGSHRVRKGETLGAIAKRYGISVSTLAAANGLKVSSTLRTGSTLNLPDRQPSLLAAAAAGQTGTTSGSAAAATAGAAEATAAAPRTYVVRAGDTLFGVANKFGLSAKQLMALNRIRDADSIFEGQRLRVSAEAAAPAGGVGAAASATVASAAPPVVTDAAEVAEAVASSGSRPDAPATEVATTPVVVAATAAADVASAEVALVAAQSGGPRTRRSGRASTSTAPAVAQTTPALVSEPVTADAQGPEVGPGADTPPPVADAIDLQVHNDSVQVIAEETLGHYADWLGVSAARLRELNRMKYGQAVLLGRSLKLDFSRVSPEEFEQKRRDFHARLQAAFFAQRRILGTEVYIVRRGDTLWSITQRYAGVPVWLLQQYNPDLELGALRAGAQLVVPRLEDIQAEVVAGR
ncbi:MAG: LysM peptidoglycan-binding domain-containing protein [Steroidobacteraceae bacterium]|nr:LysM peptidoglycan-binding domain-containing protein [Nevskiaceae bacterium]MCP5467284.1 LysM peptidoglycan-binding domain-containing protein [Nevskiaceae bacterium]